MDKRTIPSVVISTDADFRTTLQAALLESGSAVVVRGEVAAAFSKIGTAELAELRRIDPDIVFLDLEEDPVVGIRFAHFLADANPQRRFIAVGPPLGSDLLLEAMRAGISEYVPKPITRESLSEALERVGRKMAVSGNGAPRTPGEVITVFSPKGGSGATTVATNLAVHLQQLTGKKTLLVDLDLELGEVAALLGMQPRFSFVDLVRNFHRMDAGLLASYIERHSSGVHFLSAPFHPEVGETVNADGIRQILHFLKQHYDYVVVDTSKTFSPTTLATFERADRILLVTTVDLPALRNVKRCLPIIDRVSGPGSNKVSLVVNRYNPDDPITLDEVRKTLGMEVRWTLANDYASVSRSLNTGEPVVLAPKSAFGHDLRAVGADISGFAPQRNGHKNRLDFRKLFLRKAEANANG
jgi:pilus assembly protein CpaE